MPESEDNQPTYRIGAVSRLTQIPPETLRVWERRYHVVEPRRASGHSRLYDRDDVERLTIIKQLVDLGHAISTVASLSLTELRTRLDDHKTHGISPVPETPDRIPIIVVGEHLSALAREQALEMDGIQIQAAVDVPEDVLMEPGSTAPRIVVWDCRTVDGKTAKTAGGLLRRTHALRLIVVYGFSTREHVDHLAGGRITAIKGPLNVYELQRAVLESDRLASVAELRKTDVGPEDENGIPARRFSPATLARVSRMSPTVQCECPQHMVSLITQLVAFEEYSAECENRNDKDAAVHAMLRRTTAQARARLEDAMAQLMEAEGISE